VSDLKKKISSVSEKKLRREIIDTALTMSHRGLSPGRSGNVSARFGNGMLITPTGMVYDDIEPDDIVVVDGDGAVMGDQRQPSSEWRFHLFAYDARPDRHAVVHTHSMHATVLACVKKPIPAFHYMVAVAGGKDIPVVPYATFGTDELGRHVAKGLKDRDACLMASHGQIAIGETLSSALELAFEVETLAEQYYKVLLLGAAGHSAEILSDKAMTEMVEKFKSYGQKGPGG
jgi:L-fuculose-phosphate aldolase